MRPPFGIPSRAATRSAWLPIAIALALIPVSGLFTTSRVFYVRDLAWYFWPRHRWLRETLAGGGWPWWDPYIGGGQAAIPDALNQFFLLPVTTIRLMTPELVGFNLWVALPFPVAAAGAWLWLRRVVSAPSALVGASVYVLSGPMLSTGNFPNLSWSAAFIPWVLWASHRLQAQGGVRKIAVLAIVVALQALSGEAVTFAATSALCLAHALAAPADVSAWRERVRGAARAAAGVSAGVLLAAVQLLPLALAAARSSRTQNLAERFWSLHPLGLLETVHPFFFGQPLLASPSLFPWIPPLNSGREPLFYSLYFGIGVVALALLRGHGERLRRWTIFWWSVAGVSAVLALGPHTPVYTVLQQAVPVLKSFRYTVKYILFAGLALGALAAIGAEALRRHIAAEGNLRNPRRTVALLLATAVAALAIAAGNSFVPGVVSAGYRSLAEAVALKDPADGVRWLAEATTSLWIRLGVMAFVTAVLVLVVWRRERGMRLAAIVLCAVPLIDLLVVTHGLNPTTTPDILRAPGWVADVEPGAEARVYVGGLLPLRSRGSNSFVDGPERTNVPGERPFAEAHAIMGSQFLMTPSAWRVRQIVSQDLPELWPREYRDLLVRFTRRSFEERIRFLRRTGVRYCILPQAPPDGIMVRSLEPLFSGFDLYDCGPELPRVFVADQARVELNLARQADLLFDARHDPRHVVLLEREAPPAAGQPGSAAVVSDAAMIDERPTALAVRADVGENGGFLTVLDSFDPDWHVTVDGEPATLLRANVLFRAVRLNPGQHEVRFEYRPTAFFAGGVISLATALSLLVACVVEIRMRGRASLIEVHV